jgi:hypothetical protein
MITALAALVPDFGKLMQNPLWLVLYAFVVLGAAALGAVLTSVVGRYSAILFWKDLSRGWILRLRVLGGLAGAVIAYALIGHGGGVGFGPGQGGFPGRGPGTADGTKLVSLADRTDTSGEPDTSKPAAKLPAIVRVVMLGPETKPASEEPDHFFAIEGDEPLQALNVDQVVQRIRKRQADSGVQEVDLVVSKGSSSFGRPFVEPLRNRVRRELRLAFSEPNFSGDPLKDRSRFEPAKEP